MALTLTPEQQRSLSVAQAAAAAAAARAGAPAGGAAATVPVAAADNRPVGTPAVPDPNEVTTRAQILPVGVTRGGQVTLAVPEFSVPAFNALGDLISGRRGAHEITGEEIFGIGSLFGAAGPATKFVGPAGAAKAVSAVSAAGERVGVDVPRSVGSESVFTTALAKITTGIPVGGAPIQKASKTALQQLEGAATGVKDALGSSSARTAGGAVEKGLTDFAGKDGALATRVTEAYAKVEALVKPDVGGQLPATAKAAQEIAAAREAAGITAPSKAVGIILEAATRPQGLTYDGVKQLRTYIGETLKNPTALASSEISEGELKAIYGALTADMRGVVEIAGGKPAVAAWEAANATARDAAGLRETLSKVLRSDPSEEAIFGKIEGMTGTGSRGDVSTLGQVRSAVGDTGWGEVLSALVERWGFNEAGEFQPKVFANKWGKVSTEAKDVLFQTAAEKAQAKALDDIALVSTKADALRAASEPKAGGVIKGALGLAGASALVGLTVNPLQAIVPLLGSRVVSNVLAKPQGAPALATWAKAYEAFVGSPSQGTGAVLRKASTALAYRVAIQEGQTEKVKADLAQLLANSPAKQAQERQQGRDEVLAKQAQQGRF